MYTIAFTVKVKEWFFSKICAIYYFWTYLNNTENEFAEKYYEQAIIDSILILITVSQHRLWPLTFFQSSLKCIVAITQTVLCKENTHLL